MGLVMSFVGKGLPTKQIIGTVTGKFHERFVEKDIETFEEFHLAILDMFTTVNEALPGKHWDVPSREKIKECFEKCEKLSEDEKKKVVLDFMKENIKPNPKLDDSSLIIGLATPPAAMAAKKAGEGVPQLKFIKAVPDVLFIPAVTVLALASIKLSRKMFPVGSED